MRYCSTFLWIWYCKDFLNEVLLKLNFNHNAHTHTHTHTQVISECCIETVCQIVKSSYSTKITTIMALTRPSSDGHSGIRHGFRDWSIITTNPGHPSSILWDYQVFISFTSQCRSLQMQFLVDRGASFNFFACDKPIFNQSCEPQEIKSWLFRTCFISVKKTKNIIYFLLSIKELKVIRKKCLLDLVMDGQSLEQDLFTS